MDASISLLGIGAGRRNTVPALTDHRIFLGDWSSSPAALSVLRRESFAYSMSKRLVETRAFRFPLGKLELERSDQ